MSPYTGGENNIDIPNRDVRFKNDIQKIKKGEARARKVLAGMLAAGSAAAIYTGIMLSREAAEKQEAAHEASDDLNKGSIVLLGGLVLAGGALVTLIGSDDSRRTTTALMHNDYFAEKHEAQQHLREL